MRALPKLTLVYTVAYGTGTTTHRETTTRRCLPAWVEALERLAQHWPVTYVDVLDETGVSVLLEAEILPIMGAYL